MPFHSGSFENQISHTSSYLANEYTQLQQLKFIEDQLKELEQKIKHIDQIIKQRIRLIQYSQRLKIFIQSSTVQRSKNIIGSFAFSQETDDLSLSAYENGQKANIYNFELTEQDDFLLSDKKLTWQKIDLIERRIKITEQNIDLLEQQKNFCLHQQKNLKYNHSKILKSYLSTFQVDIKNIR